MLRLVACAAFLATAAVQPAVAEPRQPTGKWVVHFDQSQCLAERTYGTAAQPLTLALKQPPMGSAMQVSVVTKKNIAEPEQVNATIRFAGQQPIQGNMVVFRPKGQALGVYQMNLPLDQLARGAGAGSMHIQAPGFDETFAISGLEPLTRVLAECVEDLRQTWNVDQASAGGGNARPDAGGRLAGVFTADDYPPQALETGNAGAVEMALLVDEQGRVADCSVIETSGVAILDSQSCAIVRERASFTPAVGADGKPIKSAFVQRINWQAQ